jgi:hypothetical protein
LTKYYFVCRIKDMFIKVKAKRPTNKDVHRMLTATGLVAVTGLILVLSGNQANTQSLKVPEEAPPPSFARLENLKVVDSKDIDYSKNEQLSSKELRDLLYFVGFRGEKLVQAWAIAMKESTGRPGSHNKNSSTGDNSYGLFQINMIGSLGPARIEKYRLRSNDDLFDPVRNAKIAYRMSDGGNDWSAWGGMTDKTIYWMSKFSEND